MINNPKRGEIYLLNFSPSLDQEMKGLHPGLVIQNDVGNQASSLTIVAAITSTLKVAKLPVGIPISPEESGLDHQSVIHLGQIYTVSKKRLTRLIGSLSTPKLQEVDRAISVSLGLTAFRF